MPKYRDFEEYEDGDLELPEQYTKIQRIKRGQNRVNDASIPKPVTKRVPRPEKK